jgi:hypothetical protein
LYLTGCGGIRLREYDSVEGYVRDGMRLALGMGRKSALAGLWWGGGKGVIAHPNPLALDNREREQLMHEYGTFLTSLRGAYVSCRFIPTTFTHFSINIRNEKCFYYTFYWICVLNNNCFLLAAAVDGWTEPNHILATLCGPECILLRNQQLN